MTPLHRGGAGIIADVPGILDRVRMIDDDDRARLMAITAERLHLTDPDDLRAGVLVTTVLAVVEFGYRRWLTATTADPLLDHIDAALAAR